MRRIAPLGTLAAVLVFGLLATPPAAPARVQAQDGGLSIVSTAHYEVLPAERRVQVTIDAVATALTPDTATERFYFTGLTLSVQGGAVNAAASSEGRPIAARLVDIGSEQAGIEITFDNNLFYRERYPFRVTFDLVDNEARDGAEVRVGRTLIAFPVWAYGSRATAGSSVAVVVPGDYTVRIDGGELTRAQAADGAQLFTVDAVDDPLAFFAYLTADRPGAYVETPLSVLVLDEQLEIVIRSWEDDPAFGERMADLMRDGMPVLGELIGLELGFTRALTVEQAAGSLLGDYAGFYLDASRTIQIHYQADPFVALHEASHVWFNDRLFRTRWIGEAFASYYAELAAQRLGIEIDDRGLRDELLEGRIALNDWGEIGREERIVEDYAYAATLELGRRIGERAGLEGLTLVWLAADAGHAAYQPLVGTPEQPERATRATEQDWRRLLDLLEERTGAAYDDLWAEWVVNDDQLQLLAERAAARAAYLAVAGSAVDWELPVAVRNQLDAWSFGRSLQLLERADEVLTLRGELEASAAALDLAPSPELRALFEATTTFDDATERAHAELAALNAVATAEDALARPLTLIEELGLLGQEIAGPLASARDAYEAGDLELAITDSQTVTTVRGGAERTGRDRVMLTGAGLLALEGFILVAVGADFPRRRARRSVGMTTPAGLAPVATTRDGPTDP
jgi:hypothetical protein